MRSRFKQEITGGCRRPFFKCPVRHARLSVYPRVSRFITAFSISRSVGGSASLRCHGRNLLSLGPPDPCDECGDLSVASSTFPHRANLPAHLPECGAVSHVTCDIFVEFPVPELPVRRRRSCLGTSAVTVPEASVNEDHGVPSGEHDVRASGKVPSM